MPGCFGRRKKKSKDHKAPESGPNSSLNNHGNEKTATLPTPSEAAAEKTKQQLIPQPKPQQQQAVPQPTVLPSQPLEQRKNQPKTNSENPEQDELPDEVSETITVTRSHSVQHAAPRPGNIKKAATMSRYDFLRKQDNVSYADRWATLKQRYLPPVKVAAEIQPVTGKVTLPVAKEAKAPAANDTPALRNGPKTFRATIQSLPRQFSPAATVAPVKFSDWFYERQKRESVARQEFHDREERMLKIIEGPSSEEMEDAAVKIQAGFKGYKTRKEVQARREMQEPQP